MNLNITAKKFELTESLKDFIEERIDALSKYYDNITQGRVILEVDDGHHRHGKINGCEIILHVGNVKNEVISKAQAEDMHTAINNAVDQISFELDSIKEKQSEQDREKIRRIKEGL